MEWKLCSVLVSSLIFEQSMGTVYLCHFYPFFNLIVSVVREKDVIAFT